MVKSAQSGHHGSILKRLDETKKHDGSEIIKLLSILNEIFVIN